MRSGRSSVYYLVARALVAAFAPTSVACGGAEEGDDPGAAAAEVNEGKGESAFLDAERVVDLVTISPSFPFGVTRRHRAAGAVLGAHWGGHGGPLVTTMNAGTLKAHRWTLPDGVTEAAKEALLPSVAVPNLPTPAFWGADGFVDLPFGSLSMHSYSSAAAHSAGELIFYSKDYDRVAGRARVNGFYSGVGVEGGGAKRIVYSGLSGLSSTASAQEESGLYASDVCGDSPAPSGSCAASVKLFGWQGFSGPVTSDADGNVFVAAFLSRPGGANRGAIYGLTKSQSLATSAQSEATLAERSAGGTASIAAVGKPGSQKGWIIAKGHDDKAAAPSYARAYHSNGNAIVADGAIVENVIAAASPDASLSFFSDPKGNLWVSVELPDASWLLELQPRP